ncbi:MAG TPA: 2-oxoglutarate dehydrogenase complex dihydrolipoyllysine-residue succinyltransferase [Flavobacteriales bacterium]|jgi:2-oxoglutarate dehydrogenase E2 component (dihydrolipoamide succinyltransferase)|nr:2-oxoglutarate dehydrogenase complex dihydrolipoyllysine-residue succinyltransferase [Flavobacteriales bacterium]MBK6550014.1 2-oxoglutarate dehydrogenase complex dihydrolipoyllysine-residue succinyltransferase [Flavobacteriales bacterium]MBK7102525.1 2-oxoglutarate dehydrogenase complex dihydrolipoyllysine-residue succinyltransferase [Flavobacteriales bacterium]MBK7113258.1 2-oxoglutarate dehydrogenase complex dihydrolipoyllysine-residue succinyltransferase [Flavobacteriales bacterium]MBK74
MANVDIKVPSPGESISEVRIAQWLVADGDVVEKDQVIAEIDSDKATLELSAEESGKITLLAEADATVNVGDVVAKLDTSFAPVPKKDAPKAKEVPAEKASKAAAPVAVSVAHATPVAVKMMEEKGLSADKVKGSGPNGRITKSDVAAYVAGGVDAGAIALNGWGGKRDQSRQKMSTLRKKIAERLVTVKNQTAMLTTFNEVDMSAVMELRNKYKDKFKEEKGVNLGFMSFFTKAVTEALRLFPSVNAQLDGEEMVMHDYADIGIAVSSPKGLMVPVIRNAERMSLAEIESAIKTLAIKARDGKLSIDEMTGGTFTITNGGVFGSMLSTPILNPPQSAILGMHNIVDRPMAVNGQVVIRPVMYLALSYDHRIIDGKESVSFLMAVKQMIEDPSKMVFGNKEPGEVLLGL